jgi:hypothetical protein
VTGILSETERMSPVHDEVTGTVEYWHPAFCDVDRCRIHDLDGTPLLVHKGDHYRDPWRAIVWMQNQTLSGDLAEVLETHRPMVCLEGRWDDAPMDTFRAGDVGYALWTAKHVRGALPFPEPEVMLETSYVDGVTHLKKRAAR